MQLFGSLVQGLGTALDLYHARHRVLAENVANAETPGYRARDLEFQDVLEAAFDQKHAPRTASADELEPIVDRTATVKIDRNSVDLDTEMAKLSDNSLKIVALSRFVTDTYGFLKRAIGEVR
jgi:flagellar basal-body rod protein FlgB